MGEDLNRRGESTADSLSSCFPVFPSPACLCLPGLHLERPVSTPRLCTPPQHSVSAFCRNCALRTDPDVCSECPAWRRHRPTLRDDNTQRASPRSHKRILRVEIASRKPGIAPAELRSPSTASKPRLLGSRRSGSGPAIQEARATPGRARSPPKSVSTLRRRRG